MDKPEPANLGEVQAKVARHNALASKYQHQVDILRDSTETEQAVWEVVLGQLFLRALNDAAINELPEELLDAALGFGFQCMGVGAVMAMDGLAQETIVI